MGFVEAVKSVFGKYATFSGRASRSEFWWWVLFLIILQIAAMILDNIFGTKINYDAGSTLSSLKIQGVGWVGALVSLALIIPTLAVSVRRLHDTGKAGWWWLLNLVCCIGGLILFIFYLTPSTPGDNKYGPQPR